MGALHTNHRQDTTAELPQASVLQPIFEIGKSLVSFFKRTRKILNKVKTANTAIYTDIEIKLDYLRRMVNKLVAGFEEIEKCSNRFNDSSDNQTKIKALREILMVCRDIVIYERSLTGTDFNVFEKYKDELAKGGSAEYRFAMKFYNIFATLLNQSRFGLYGIEHEFHEKEIDVGFILHMLGRVAEAYSEFFEELQNILE